MDLIKITDLSAQLGLSARTLRYYEEAGLIKSIRPQFEAYRFYDEAAVERLRQIMVLRKMQIPIKDIARIYDNPEIATLVDVFVGKINEIDGEVTALSELKSIINTFLKKMIESGIKRISALPLLYEEMDKQLELMQEQNPVTYETLDAVSEKIAKPIEPAIISLPAMLMLTSFLKAEPKISDIDGFWYYVLSRDIKTGTPGLHERFEYQTGSSEAVMLRVPDDFANGSDYLDASFDGGLFAAANVYVDEDLGACFRSLIGSFDDNKFYEIDYSPDGNLRHPALLEDLISPDEKRELVSLLVPVKKRLADPALFEKPVEIQPGSITTEEIEAQNQVLWEREVPLDKLTPIKPSGGYIRYEMLPTREALFSTYVSTRYMSTNADVKIPFRVDVVFRCGEPPANADEGFRFYWGDSRLEINEENNPDSALSKHAIRFVQPVFMDQFKYYNRGKILMSEYNHVTWIVGDKCFSVIINGEVRLCMTNLPYMNTELSLLPGHPVMINGGGDMAIVIRNINILQLKSKPKIKIKKGDFEMHTRQNNNYIESIDTFCIGENGENFAFDGACEQLMKCIGENDFNYWLIAGITGDCYAQVYPKNQIFHSDRYCVSDYHILYDSDCSEYIEAVFGKMGYSCTYVPIKNILSNREMYRQTLMAYIDKGTPVIQFKGNYSLICGYEDHGKVLLQRYPCESNTSKFTLDEGYFSDKELKGWIFIGEKNTQTCLADIYREAVVRMPEVMTTESKSYRFGAKAFIAWAEAIENGFYDGKTSDEVDLWGTHTSFVCDFETISAKCKVFLQKAFELNPDMSFIPEISEIISRQGAYANSGLEDLNGGFNVTLEVLQDKEKREKIGARLRSFANSMDKVVRIINKAQKSK